MWDATANVINTSLFTTFDLTANGPVNDTIKIWMAFINCI